MKKDGKLHTVTKWNRPAFMSDENLFAIGGDFFQHQGVNATGNGGSVGLPPVNWSDPMQRRIATSMTKGIVDTFTLGNNNAAASFGSTGLGLANSPKDKSAVLSNDPNILLTSTPAKSGGSNGLFGKDTWKSGGAGWATLGAASNVLDAVPTGERRGLWDTLDPVHHLAGGRESGVGNTLGDTGVALTKAGISSGKPWLALAGAGLKVVGGLTNAAFGIKTDKEALAAANQAINANKNFVSKAESFDDIKGPASMTNTNVYQGGWFSGGKADRKNQELAQQMQDAYSWADRSIVNNIDNLAADQLNNSLRNYAAFGGPLEQMAMDNNGIGAIGYGLMSDYIASRNRQVENKNKMTGLTAGTGINTFGLGGCVPNVFCGGGRYFDFGGNMQTNSADYPTGLTHIDAGQSHEQNPNGGVQMGTDSEGTPNLVEEGETVFNDYVFSDRISIDDTTKEKFHIGKKQEMTYAKLSKKLEKEVAEHPNDPIAQRGFQAQMQQLQEQQERQKQEMEAEKAQEAFASLSPEEQTAMMQQRAAQEQQAMVQQQMAAQQGMSPEEQMMAEQQMEAQGAPMVEEPQVAAYGGHLFDLGGAAWIRENHPEVKNPAVIAKVMERMMQEDKEYYYRPDVSMFGGPTTYKWHFDAAWKNMIPMVTSLGSAEKHFNKLVNLGMSRQDAWDITFSDRIYNQYMGKNREAKKKEYDNYYKRLVTDPSKPRTKKYRALTGEVFATRAEAQVANKAYYAQKKDVAPVQTHNEDGTTSKKYRALSGKVYNTRREAIEDNAAAAKQRAEEANARKAVAQQVAQQAPQQQASEAPAAVQPEQPVRQAAPQVAAPVSTQPEVPAAVRQAAIEGIIPYGYYTNGSDGYSTPTGFKVDDKGNATDYTKEYTDLVNRLGADDIRAWAAEHPEDVSLQSFLERNGDDALEALNDKQWRAGATDGKYGFMHHVADRMLNNPGTEIIGTGNKRVEDAIMDAIEKANVGLSDSDIAKIAGMVAQQRGAVPNDNTAASGNTGEGGGDQGAAAGNPSNQADTNGSTAATHPEADPENALNYGDPQVQKNVEAGLNPDGIVPGRKIVPVLRDEWPRYVGLAGPAVGLGLWAAGVGKPDYSALDAAVNAASQPAHLASYQTLGNYLAYRPLDIWYEQNRMDANSRATDRNIMNTSGGNRGTAMAGLLTNGYNTQIADGALFRQAQEYNDKLRQQVAEFNRGTDQFNAIAYNNNSQFNAQARNNAAQTSANARLHAAQTRLGTDAGWYNSLYANIGNLFKGISDLGRENADRNQVARLVASGAIPGITPEHAMNAGWIKYADEPTVASKGGKLKRKKKMNLSI